MTKVLESRRTFPKFRPTLEALEDRFVPANPHFLNAASSIDAAGALTADFKIAGLGNNETLTVGLTGDAEASYQWFNKAGNKPQGQPFSAALDINVSGDFTSDKNGNIVGSFTVQPPPPPEDFLTHPHAASWTAQASVSYTDLVLSGGGDSIGLADQSGSIKLNL